MVWSFTVHVDVDDGRESINTIAAKYENFGVHIQNYGSLSLSLKRNQRTLFHSYNFNEFEYVLLQNRLPLLSDFEIEKIYFIDDDGNDVPEHRPEYEVVAEIREMLSNWEQTQPPPRQSQSSRRRPPRRRKTLPTRRTWRRSGGAQRRR